MVTEGKSNLAPAARAKTRMPASSLRLVSLVCQIREIREIREMRENVVSRREDDRLQP